MTIQFWSKFIFVFGILQFVARVHCKGLGEPHSTNALDRAFGNVLTSTLEKQTKATEEMFEIKMADHRDELIEMFDAKLEKQKNDFVQLLDDKMEQQNENCNQRMNEKFEEFQTALEDLKDRLTCPIYWKKVSNSCILLSSEKTNFDTAVKKCKDQGGKLYEPQSLSHNQMVYALIEEKGLESKNFWVGIHDKNTENSFVYQSNNQPIAFQHWGSYSNENGAQPNNMDGHQDCVQIYGTGSTWNGPKGSWNDRQCSDTNGFICEKEAQ